MEPIDIMISRYEDDLSCPVCHDIFKDPVVLSCSHSFCKECLQQFWSIANTRMCPLCKRVSRVDPPCNLVLKNLCELFVKERNEMRSAIEEICGSHGENHTLFCLEDKQPVCEVCVTSQQHHDHTIRLLSEVASPHKEELKTALKPLQEKLKHKESIKKEFEKTLQHIKAQADRTKDQIKQQFETLHRFLRYEEEVTLTALREEEEQKKQMMKEKLGEINRHILALSLTIKDTEEMLKDNDVCFLKKFPGSMERVQISQPDPQTPSGALIHEPRYLGNLPFRVWKKMQDIIHYMMKEKMFVFEEQAPVILDPNTAHPHLLLSEDLTRVRDTRNRQPRPDNPESFDHYLAVLGSEGYNSGSHSWEVELRESQSWIIGVTTASNQRKGGDFFKTGVWCLEYDVFSPEDALISSTNPNFFPVHRDISCVRVELNYNRGTVSFSDPDTYTHIHTFTTTFTDTVFPFFWCDYSSSLKILPLNSVYLALL